jgi:hypothetical protein
MAGAGGWWLMIAWTLIGASIAVGLAAAGARAADEAGAGDGPWADPEVAELSGSVTVEGRLFPNPPRFAGQRRNDISLALEPEYYVAWADDTSLTVAPFLRLDRADPERSHFDVRELFLRVVGEDWELGAGAGKVFWGRTESVHLVDIVNQTDQIENIDLEDKLGQPMLNLSLIRDWGYLDLFYLPYFRERTFQGRRGRLRNALIVDRSQTRYESGLERWHPDFAVRYSNVFGDWDLGVYQFYGTAREPTLRPGVTEGGAPALVPDYELIHQTGADVQYTTGAWLWKLEALYRAGQRNRLGAEENYAAFAGGFEYTAFGAAGSDADVGLLAEYLWDERKDRATNAFQNDLFLGLRLALNDAEGTAVLAGVIQDLSTGTRLFNVEASRRLGASFVLSLEVRLFTDVGAGDVLADLRDDDLVQVELGYFF